MKIGACQFAVSGNIAENMESIRLATEQAARERLRLLVLPECALTGYPPRNLPSSDAVDFNSLETAISEVQAFSARHDMCIIAGSITRENGVIHNSALAFMPGGSCMRYHKRALWGWDRENFSPGSDDAVLELDGLRIGIRICYEIRFPEYFRELYRRRTDLNIVLFHDVADADDSARYELIKAHLRTRAAENICPVLSVNATRPFQTAPTLLCAPSGDVLADLKPHSAGLLAYELHPSLPSFSERGRREISDKLTQ